MTLTNSTLSRNVASDGSGGGINSLGGNVTLTNSTVSGNSASRVPNSSESPVGGGISAVGGRVTVTNSTISDNAAEIAGGVRIAPGVIATLLNSIVSDNSAVGAGGGILSEGFLSLTNSTVSANSTQYVGGGIANFPGANLSVTGSTLSNNSADYLGGGVANYGFAYLSNSTISGNTATGNGGGVSNYSDAFLRNCTIVGNRAIAAFGGAGGGLDNKSTLGLHDTIVAGNFVRLGSSDNDIAGDDLLPTSDFNLIGDPDSAGGLTNGVNGNIVGKTAGSFQIVRPIGEILDPVLRNNGGPTLTHALVSGSAAHESGNPALGSGFDQRGLGYPRTVGPNPDIGAFELASPLFTDRFSRANGSLGLPWKTRAGSLAVVQGHAQGTGATKVHLATLAGFSQADVDLHLTVNLGPNQSAGLVARYSGSGDRNYYAATLQSDSAGVVSARLLRNVNGVIGELAIANNVVTSGILRFRVVGSTLQLWLNDVPLASFEDTKFKTGAVGIRTIGETGMDNLLVFAVSTGVGSFDGFNRPDNAALSDPWLQKLGTLQTVGNRIRGTQPVNIAVLNAASESDVELRAVVSLAGVNNSVGLLVRYQGSGDRNYYLAGLTRTQTGFAARIVKNVGGKTTTLASTKISSTAIDAELRFVVTGINLRLLVSNIEVANVLDRSLTKGSVGIRSDRFATVDNFHSAAISTEISFGDEFTQLDGSDLIDVWTRRAGDFTIEGGQALATAAKGKVSLATLAGMNVANVIVSANVSVFQEVGLVACYSGKGDSNYYMARIRTTGAGFSLSIVKNIGGRVTTLKSINVPTITGGIRFIVEGNKLSLFMNFVLQVKAIDNSLHGGSAGIRSIGLGAFDNVFAIPTSVLPFTDDFPESELSDSWVQRMGKFRTVKINSDDKAQGSGALNVATLGRFNIAEVSVEAGVSVGAVKGRFASLIVRASGPGEKNMYQASVLFNGTNFEALISKTVSAVTTLLAKVDIGSGTGSLRFAVVGSTLTLFFDGVEVLSASDFSLQSGSVGIRSSVDSTFDIIRVSEALGT